jgi:hypothetical protein
MLRLDRFWLFCTHLRHFCSDAVSVDSKRRPLRWRTRFLQGAASTFRSRGFRRNDKLDGRPLVLQWTSQMNPRGRRRPEYRGQTIMQIAHML